MGRSFGRRSWSIFWRIELRMLSPLIIAGAHISYGVCWKISIIAELFGGRSGLGYMMQWSEDFGSVNSIIAICLAIVFFVVLGDALIMRPLSQLFQPKVRAARRRAFGVASRRRLLCGRPRKDTNLHTVNARKCSCYRSCRQPKARSCRRQNTSTFKASAHATTKPVKANPSSLYMAAISDRADSASSAPVWSLNFLPLSESFRVVSFDKIGQGHTDNPTRNDDYTMASVVRHAAAFIETLKLPPVHLVGHSRGGYASTRLALEYPHLVRSLTIVSTGTLSPRVSTNEVVLANCPYPSFSRESARWVYENYSYDPKVVTEEWIDNVMDVFALEKYRVGVRKMVDEAVDRAISIPNSPNRNARRSAGCVRAGCSGRPRWSGP